MGLQNDVIIDILEVLLRNKLICKNTNWPNHATADLLRPKLHNFISNIFTEIVPSRARM